MVVMLVLEVTEETVELKVLQLQQVQVALCTLVVSLGKILQRELFSMHGLREISQQSEVTEVQEIIQDLRVLAVQVSWLETEVQLWQVVPVELAGQLSPVVLLVPILQQVH
jgi:hypothetical protein